MSVKVITSIGKGIIAAPTPRHCRFTVISTLGEDDPDDVKEPENDEELLARHLQETDSLIAKMLEGEVIDTSVSK